MPVINFENGNYKEITNDGLVIVDYFATWCGPCKMIAPEYEKTSDELRDVKFIKIDIDSHRELALKNQVKAVPTLIIYKDGVEVSRESGYKTSSDIVKWLSVYNSVL